MYAVLSTGGKFAAMETPDPESMCRLIERWRLTYTPLFPGVITNFIRFPDRRSYDLSSFRLAIGFATLLTTQVHREFAEEIGVPFHDMFGGTETSYIAVGPIDVEAGRWENKIPMPYMDLRVVDDELNELPVGESDEFVVRGPNVCSGYLNKPEATAELFRGGWLHTGDVGVRNEDGTFSFTDRKKYLIKTGGENVYPTEVERVVALHPAVQEVCVVSVPDDHWGETVKACVVLREWASMDKVEIASWCADRLASYKKPRYVEFLAEEDLPRSISGKVMRELLAKRAVSDEQMIESQGSRA